MKQDGCNTCLALDKDCGGHWSRRNYPQTRAPRVSLDTYDAAHLTANADYSVYEEDGE